MLIHFESVEQYTITLNKKAPMEMDFPEIEKKVVALQDTGIVDRVVSKHTQYWIPKEQIKQLKEKKGHYFVNDIEVDETNFNSVIKQWQENN